MRTIYDTTSFCFAGNHYDRQYIYISHINGGVIQGFPALRKAVTTQVKKYRIFSRAGNRVCTIGEIDPALFLI